ncbi:Hypothetical predicted protein [Pelobates cultripes]|uniref:Uncharacterized protein n=1 Tax=Pelobates cultripes TaxID=61616 RepID=A0AAD1WAM2_PELCU|nr:Hypothetical predicted protein [Pelobates cultripes]
MEKHSKKLREDQSPGTWDIGTFMRQPAKPAPTKMAPVAASTSASLDKESLPDQLPSFSKVPAATQEPPAGGDTAPSTKADIKALLYDKQAIQVDVAGVREEVATLTDRLFTMEDDMALIVGRPFVLRVTATGSRDSPPS